MTSFFEDQETFLKLTDLFTNADANIASIQATIQSIGAAQNSYDDFLREMDHFRRYEEMVEARLKQLKSFVEDTSSIETEEQNMNSLENKMAGVTSKYADIVSKNNVLALQVNTLYNTVKDRLTTLSHRSALIANRVDEYTRLISEKRANGYVKSCTVLLNVTPGLVARGSPLIFETTNSANENVTFPKSIVPGRQDMYDLGFGFLMSADRTTILLGDTGKTARVTVNIEVMSTEGKVIDTITKFSVIKKTINNGLGETITQQDMSALTSVSLTMIGPSDSFTMRPLTKDVVISSAIITLSFQVTTTPSASSTSSAPTTTS
jgi:hypothetical protein